MKHTKPARIVIATAALALGATLAACNDSDENDSDGNESVAPLSSPSAQPAESPSAAPGEQSTTAAPEPESDVLTLEESAEVSPDGPTWSFPLRVDGWELGTFDQQGVNQLTKDDGQSTLR